MNRTSTGTISGFIATITLGEVNLFLGSLAALVTIICLLPTGIKNYRDLIQDYRQHQSETGSRGLFAFVDYLLVRRLQRAETKTAAIPVVDNSNAKRAD